MGASRVAGMMDLMAVDDFRGELFSGAGRLVTASLRV